MYLSIKVHLFNSPFMICHITEDNIAFPREENYNYKSIGVNVGDSNTCEEMMDDDTICKKKWRLKAPALFLQSFVNECMISKAFRMNMLKNFHNITGSPDRSVVFLKLIFEPPDKELIDYSWNERMLRIIWTKVEIENAFSWLSTLGGAYSALGDYFEHCADEAGRISKTQYKLSLMLGDESLAARSRLYSALAHAQKGNLKLSRHIVRDVAAFARMTQDRRLNRMCQGIWAKLKYLRQMEQETKTIIYFTLEYAPCLVSMRERPLPNSGTSSRSQITPSASPFSIMKHHRLIELVLRNNFRTTG